jgi:uncharacterized protein YlxP (DUF503 family)
MSAYVALLLVDLHFPQAGSLKAKRKELSSLKGQLQSRLNCAVAEVGYQDTWQRAQLSVALTSGSLGQLDREIATVERFIIDRFPDTASVQQFVTSAEDIG